MDLVRRMRRPGATVTGLLVLAYGAVQVAKGNDWPQASWWADDSAGQTAFVVLAIITSLAMFLVVIGYRRILTREKRREQWMTAADSFARLVVNSTTLRPDEIGVNIWLVKGMWGFRRLVRQAKVAPSRHETPITWTKGKGIIGQAWARRRTRFADLDDVRSLFPTQAAWCTLEREDRFRLSWTEFSETSRYRAVLAIPLRRHRFALHLVRGVAAIDVLVPGKASELNGIQTSPTFSSIVRTCEAAFAGD